MRTLMISLALLLAILATAASATQTIVPNQLITNTGPVTVGQVATTFAQGHVNRLREWPPDAGVTAHNFARFDRDEVLELSLGLSGAVSTPASAPAAGTGQICYGLRGDPNFGNYTLLLLEGATTRKSISISFPPVPAAGNAWGNECIALSEAEVASVTDWSDARLRITANYISSTALDVDAMKIDIPDAAPVCGDGVQEGAEACDDGGSNVTPGTCGPGQTCCTTSCEVEMGPAVGGCQGEMYRPEMYQMDVYGVP